MLSQPQLVSLSSSLLPCSDLRLAAQSATGLDWKQIFALLPPEVAALQTAASTETTRSLSLRVENLTANFQVPHAALHASDLGNSRTLITRHGRTIDWSIEYIRKSANLRMQLFAWHYFAAHIHNLPSDWNLCAEKVDSMRRILHDRLGFHLLQPASTPLSNVPESSSSQFSKARRSSRRATHPGMEPAPSLTCDLATYQRRTMLSAPTNVSLSLALTGHLQGELSDDCKWMVDRSRYSSSDSLHVIPSWIPGGPSTQFFLDANGSITAVYDPSTIRRSKKLNRSLSNWQDAGINWKGETIIEEHVVGGKRRRSERVERKEIPVFDITRVVARAEAWRELLPDLTAAARVILEGKGTFPMASGDVPPFDRPNLPTCQYAEAVVDTLVAEYLITGAFEYCPPGFEPRCISPMGLVVKKTAPFWRLIIDMRQVNEYMARWPSKMSGLAANALLFNPGAVAWSRDIRCGYLNVPLGGCDQGVHGGDDDTTRTKIIKCTNDGLAVRRRWVGCTPQSCKGQCSKTLMGVRWKDNIFRMCCTWFGCKSSGQCLDVLLTPIWRKIRRMGVHVVDWVDDSCYILPNTDDPTHDPATCGQRDGCHYCRDTFERAEKLEVEIDELLEALGFLKNEKATPPAQTGEFIGICYDTIRSVFWMTAEKASKLVEDCADILSHSAPTPRLVSKIRGKLQWFTPCLEGVSLLTRAMNAYIGGIDASDKKGWDLCKPLSQELIRELEFWIASLPSMAEVAKPMVATPATLLIQRFLQGLPSVDYVLCHDASVEGVGAILTAHPSRLEPRREMSSRWDPVEITGLWQSHLEMLGGSKAVEAFLPILRGKSVLHLTDCLPVRCALSRGSKESAFLQQESLRLWKLMAQWNVHHTSDWITGKEMMEIGVDALSREATFDAHDVRVTDDTWTIAHQLASNAGMRLHVDYFADEHNRKLPRFWSRYHTSGVEGVNALEAPSWGQNYCSICSGFHDQGIFLFPPIPLMLQTIAKAKRDRAHGVILTQARTDKAWWPVLQAASSARNIIPVNRTEAFTHFGITSETESKRITYASGKWFLVAFNFSSNLSFNYAQECFGTSNEKHWTAPGLSPALLGQTKHLQALQAQQLRSGPNPQQPVLLTRRNQPLTSAFGLINHPSSPSPSIQPRNSAWNPPLQHDRV